MPTTNDASNAAARASAWKQRAENLKTRAYSAHQRDLAAVGRTEAAMVREQAAGIRADAARIRDGGARTRDDGARVRDRAALVRDQAAKARDLATHTREESLRRRLLDTAAADKGAWTEILELDRLASDQSRDAAARDREAAELDRVAAEHDRKAAEHDRSAAARDHEAADKDREAADKDRLASDSDRAAADGDRLATERELQFAEEWLSKSDRLASMGRLAAGIAHEINNPLATLKLVMEALELDLANVPGAGEALTLVRDAALAVDRIAHVVSDMRAWLYGEGDAVERRPVDVKKLVDDALRLTASRVEPAAKVVVDLQPVPVVTGVASRLGQVLTNLLLNAARACVGQPGPHEVRVTASTVDDRLRLEVKDSGVGIAADVLPHIFDPFFTTQEGSGGTGLGLALSQRIITDHQGTLTVESVVGQGSTFRIELPGSPAALSQTAAEKPEGSPVLPVRRTRARVLIIDDDRDVARSLARLLSSRCDVTVAHDGAEGLEVLGQPGAAFELVLCDVMMPVMNGVQVYRALLARAPQQAADLVFMSGGTTTGDTTSFLEKLPNLLLLKPFELRPLYELIAQRLAVNAPS